MSNSKDKNRIRPLYQNVGHFNLPPTFTIDAFKTALQYQPRSDDLFIVTYPKCGTTWVQCVISLIFRNGRPFLNALEFAINAPFLEVSGALAAETMERPGVIKIHLPFHLSPYSPNAKYIFMVRNPKDCCVAFYYHTKNIPQYEFQNGSFDDFFEVFLNGEVDFGDYFDTVLSWFEHKNDPNVLFITYEDLHENTEKSILKIAAFMGKKYKETLESNPKLLKDVLHYSSFTYMKEFFRQQSEEMQKITSDKIHNNPKLSERIQQMITKENNLSVFCSIITRKGIIGDWRNHFSVEQSQRMDKKFNEKFKGTDILNWWKEEMKL